MRILLANLGLFLVFNLTFSLAADERIANNGNLVMQDIPVIPDIIVKDLMRYQNVRSAGLLAWSKDGRSVYVKTRFGDVSQIHVVNRAGGSRRQMTFFDEPVGRVQRQPQGQQLAFTMDAGGSEFTQIFLLDPVSGDSVMLSDGESRNGGVLWTRDGKNIAYRSTRRNGKSNDVWMMAIDQPDQAGIIFKSPDGTSWSASDFDEAGETVLLQNYVSVIDSRIHLLNVKTGEAKLLAGGEQNRSLNLSVGFDQTGEGFFFVTDRAGEFAQLAWAPVKDANAVRIITQDIAWDVEDMAFSPSRKQAAFVVNADGINELYLLDTRSFKYQQVHSLPVGLIGKIAFSPDGRKLAMTLNNSSTPSDTFVLSLGKRPLKYGGLERWTYSEVGGLDTSQFVQPELVHYQSFDGLEIPAFVYKPEGNGPFPVIISIHGGPEGQALPLFSSTYQMWLAKLGVAILVPNVRGSAGYGKSYLQLDNGFKREDSVKDIGALLDWIAQQKHLNAKQVAVYGGSYGGYMVLAAAVHYSDRLKAAVDVVGISNFVTFLENTQDYRRDLRRVEYGDERIPEMRAHLQAISPLNNVDKISIPMLVVQGQNDPRVPVTEATQLVDALRRQGQEVWFMNALNEGHGYRKKENRDVYQQATMMFLKKYLLDEQ